MTTQAVALSDGLQLELNLRIAPKTTPEMVKQVTPMVNKFVNDLYRKIVITDASVERDDLMQTAWMYVCEAVNQYDPDRGAKLTTFVFLKLMTKFSNITRKFVSYSRNCPLNQSTIIGIGAAIDDRLEDGEIANIPDNLFDILEAEAARLEDRSDVKRMLLSLNKKNQTVMVKHFVHGRTYEEIARNRKYGNGPADVRRRVERAKKQIRSVFDDRLPQCI